MLGGYNEWLVEGAWGSLHAFGRCRFVGAVRHCMLISETSCCFCRREHMPNLRWLLIPSVASVVTSKVAPFSVDSHTLMFCVSGSSIPYCIERHDTFGCILCRNSRLVVQPHESSYANCSSRGMFVNRRAVSTETPECSQ